MFGRADMTYCRGCNRDTCFRHHSKAPDVPFLSMCDHMNNCKDHIPKGGPDGEAITLIATIVDQSNDNPQLLDALYKLLDKYDKGSGVKCESQ